MHRYLKCECAHSSLLDSVPLRKFVLSLSWGNRKVIRVLYIHFQVEMYGGEVDEDEIMAVEGQDGNQYVVLEVIQLQVLWIAFFTVWCV